MTLTPWDVPSQVRQYIAVQADTGCWVWAGTKTRDAYGVLTYESHHTSPHRLLFEMFTGPIPAGWHIHHECEARPCCNPDHLVAVDPDAHRRMARGRPRYVAMLPKQPRPPKTECIHGHSLDDAYVSAGRRECRTCKLDGKKRARARKPLVAVKAVSVLR